MYDMNKRTPKLGHNIQLSVEASEYLKVLCRQLDMSKSGVVEFFIMNAKHPPKSLEPKP